MKRLAFLIAAAACVSLGCMEFYYPFYAFALVAGDADVQRRLSESRCRDAACDRGRWEVLGISESYISRGFDGINDRPPEDPVVRATRNRRDGRMAVALQSGLLTYLDDTLILVPRE